MTLAKVSRALAIAWLILFGVIVVLGSSDDRQAMAPTAFLAAGYLFGDTVIRRRNGNGPKSQG